MNLQIKIDEINFNHKVNTKHKQYFQIKNKKFQVL